MKQRNIQPQLKPYYESRPLQLLCEEFDKLMNTLWREQQKLTALYPWLGEDDERRNLNVREILEKYVNQET